MIDVLRCAGLTDDVGYMAFNFARYHSIFDQG